MIDERTARLELGRHLVRLVRTADGRQALRDLGHKPEKPLIAALDTDTIGEVFGRIASEAPTPPAVVLVFYADRQHMCAVSIMPAGPYDPARDDHDVHALANIGALIDYLNTRDAEGGEVRFRITDWAVATAGRPTEVLC